MLVEGELDAVIDPEIIQPVLDKDRRVKRLFENYKEVEVGYYRSTGIFPIMHTTAIRQEIVERHPWVPRNRRRLSSAPKRSPCEKSKTPEGCLWHGFSTHSKNRKKFLVLILGPTGSGRQTGNLATLIQYSHEQGLIGKSIPVEELFVETTRS